MALFKSKEEKETRARMAMQKGKREVQKYIHNCHKCSDKYTDMARKAIRIGSEEQGKLYVASRLAYEKQAAKWEGWLLTVDDLSMRGEAMSAMNGLVRGLNGLSQMIEKGLSAKEVGQTQLNLQRSMGKVTAAESQMSDLLSDLDPQMNELDGFENESTIPSEMRSEVDSVFFNLKNEAETQTVSLENAAGGSHPSTPVVNQNTARMFQDLKKFRQERN